LAQFLFALRLAMTDDPKTQNQPPLKRRGDNVGQSGRWRREDRQDDGAERYGDEEQFHSTDHPEGAPHEAPLRQPNADKPNASTYEGDFAAPQEGEGSGDDKSRYRNKGYSDAGGEIGGNQPKHPGTRWKESGAGHGEDYGARGKNDDDATKGERKKP
jgi:hypothetical protein